MLELQVEVGDYNGVQFEFYYTMYRMIISPSHRRLVATQTGTAPASASPCQAAALPVRCSSTHESSADDGRRVGPLPVQAGRIFDTATVTVHWQ
jgi:hypothetical protein